MINKQSKIYKIRDKETGLFSKGGSREWNIWTRAGKSWSNIGHVKNHLHAYIDHNGAKKNDYPYHNAEVIEVEINYEDCFKTDVEELVSIMTETKAKQEEKFRTQHEKWMKAQELKQLEALEKKYRS